MSVRPLRVLVVLPMYGGSLPIGQYCTQALRDLGHNAQSFDAPHFYGAFSALRSLNVTSDRIEQLESSFLQVVAQAILAKVETFEPDLVLALAQAPMSRKLLQRLSRQGVPTAMWFVEDYTVFTYWQAYAPLYDVFAVIQKESFLDKLHAAGQHHAFYLPMAALPSVHRPVQLTPQEMQEYGADIAFVGAGYPNRRMVFRALTHKNFKIWGTEWDGEPLLEAVVQRHGARISPEDCIRIYNATRININLHSSTQARELVPVGDFVNPRTFELAASGAFQLVDARTLLPELFTPDCLATFTNTQEMLEKIDYYLAHPEARAHYIAKARACVLQHHTYAHRMQTLLEKVAEFLPSWPKQRVVCEFDPEIPQERQEELHTLLESLQLPANAPFDDIIERLRQRTGVLSDTETTLLFLDEWRKQYKK